MAEPLPHSAAAAAPENAPDASRRFSVIPSKARASSAMLMVRRASAPLDNYG